MDAAVQDDCKTRSIPFGMLIIHLLGAKLLGSNLVSLLFMVLQENVEDDRYLSR